jgi:hypothetical protein
MREALRVPGVHTAGPRSARTWSRLRRAGWITCYLTTFSVIVLDDEPLTLLLPAKVALIL